MSLNNIAVFSFTATANQQPTAGANGTNPGAPLASELFPPPNGRGGVDARASEDDGNNGTQQPAYINSIIFLVLNDAIQCTLLVGKIRSRLMCN